VTTAKGSEYWHLVVTSNLGCVKSWVFVKLVTYVTGSVKTGHNCTSINLQYKALNTLGAYLYIVEKFHKFFERFLVKEGHNYKNLDIILFTCSRGV